MGGAHARKGILTLLGVVGALALAGCGGESGPASVDGKAIIKAKADEWLSYGRTYDEQRFSPLTAVNRDTVSKLGLA